MTILLTIILSLVMCKTNAQHRLPINNNTPSEMANSVSNRTLQDSITAYAGKMVTTIAYKNSIIDSIEFFDCGNFSVVTGKGLDSLFKAIKKKKRKKEHIDTLLKKTYDKEILSLEQKNCKRRILSAYFKKDVGGCNMLDDAINTLYILETNKVIKIEGAALADLLQRAMKENGYDILPYIIKHNKYEWMLLRRWNQFDY